MRLRAFFGKPTPGDIVYILPRSEADFAHLKKGTTYRVKAVRGIQVDLENTHGVIWLSDFKKYWTFYEEAY